MYWQLKPWGRRYEAFLDIKPSKSAELTYEPWSAQFHDGEPDNEQPPTESNEMGVLLPKPLLRQFLIFLKFMGRLFKQGLEQG